MAECASNWMIDVLRTQARLAHNALRHAAKSNHHPNTLDVTDDGMNNKGNASAPVTRFCHAVEGAVESGGGLPWSCRRRDELKHSQGHRSVDGTSF